MLPAIETSEIDKARTALRVLQSEIASAIESEVSRDRPDYRAKVNGLLPHCIDSAAWWACWYARYAVDQRRRDADTKGEHFDVGGTTAPIEGMEHAERRVDARVLLLEAATIAFSVSFDPPILGLPWGAIERAKRALLAYRDT